MTSKRRILILGGTTEARLLAKKLQNNKTLEVIYSLAGVTRAPVQIPSSGRISFPAQPKVRVGGFGGIEGLKNYLRIQGIDEVIDATHPFASQMTYNAFIACRDLGLKHKVLQRPAWPRQKGDHWISLARMAEAVEYLCQEKKRHRVLLTTGQKEILDIAEVASHKFWARMIETPRDAEVLGGYRNLVLLFDRGPFDEKKERILFEEKSITLVVTKNSGGAATYAKIAIAREKSLPVLMVARPPLPKGVLCFGPEEFGL